MPWTEKDERRFVQELEQELDKVFTFQKVKSQEIVRRIKASEKEVNDVIAKADQGSEEQRNGDNAPTEEDFDLLEEDLRDIIADVHDLAKFTQLNYTGFQKIIKKHDVRAEHSEHFVPSDTDGIPETNLMASKACVCGETACQALLQGQLRCLYCQAIQVIRPSSNKGQPRKRRLCGRRISAELCPSNHKVLGSPR